MGLVNIEMSERIYTTSLRAHFSTAKTLHQSERFLMYSSNVASPARWTQMLYHALERNVHEKQMGVLVLTQLHTKGEEAGLEGPGQSR